MFAQLIKCRVRLQFWSVLVNGTIQDYFMTAIVNLSNKALPRNLFKVGVAFFSDGQYDGYGRYECRWHVWQTGRYDGHYTAGQWTV